MDTRDDYEEVKGSSGGLLLRRILFFGPLLVLVGTFFGMSVLGSLKPQTVEKEETIRAVPVLVENASRENTSLEIVAQGEVKPRTEIALVPQISGKIVYVSSSFLEGGAFKQGDVLVQIDPAEYKLRVIQAEATVAQARTRLRNEEAEAEIARNEAVALGLSEETSDLAFREPQLAEAQAQVLSAEAALEEAELQLERASIIAPFDGRIMKKTAGLGQYVTPGMELARIFSIDIMEVALPLTDNELGQLGLRVGYIEGQSAKGPTVELEAFVAGEAHKWEGRITRTDSGYDPQTRVLFAYATVEDPYGVGADKGVPLASGLFVTATVAGKNLEDVVVIPRNGLRGTDRVFLATDDNQLEIRQVSVISSDRKRALISAGLNGDEVVITSPIRGAADGMPIEVVGREKEKPVEAEADVAPEEEAASITQASAN